MFNKIIKSQKILFFIVSLLMPSMALAAGTSVSTPNFSALFTTGLASSSTLPELIYNIINLALFFAFGVAVLYIIIGGYFWMTAQGNDEQAEKGKKALTNAIIGIIVIIMSYAIVSVVRNTLYGGAYVSIN